MTTMDSAVIRTSAPVRLDFAGAWTDVAPFAAEERGVVVNAAIELRTRVELRLNHSRYDLRSDELDERVEADTLGELARDGRLELLKAAVRSSGTGPCALRASAAAPPGSGLGTSGALSVALVYAFAASRGDRPNALAIARDAWQLETMDAGVAGGQQDQYAAALGGFQHLVFDHGTTQARSLHLEPAFASELAAHVVVCHTGRSRFSGGTIARVMQAYVDRDRVVVGALHALVDVAEAMAEALLNADLAAVGKLLNANWIEQRRLDSRMQTPAMARLEAALSGAGALGGKAAGAGAGGSMFFVVPGDTAPATAAATECGARLIPVEWAADGVRRIGDQPV
ncbi:MAG: hypothetical protein ACRELE_03085 [Gemmatimonadales bacterium]